MSRDLLAAWQRTLRRRAADPAVIEAAGGHRATFAELDQRAERWIALHAAPFGGKLAHTAVVYARPNGLGWFDGFLGLLKAGAVVVPVDGSEPPEAQRQLARVLRAGFLWTGDRLEPLANPRRFRDPDIGLIKLTSGSTGLPRPLIFTDRQMLMDGRQVTASMGITSRDLNYALIPLGHSYGLGNLTVPLLAQGVPLVCGSAPLPHAIASDFASWKPTVFPGVPSLWRALAATPVVLPGLRLAISAGAPLPPEVAVAFAQRFGLPLKGFYGSSETGGITFDRTGRTTLAGGVGTAMRGVTLTPLRGRRLEVSSAAVGTHGNRRRRGDFGAWLMADRVELGQAGQVRLLGRRGTTVKLAGRRVDLGEIVARLKRIPGVRDAWAEAGGDRDPVLGAAVATEISVADLRAALRVDTPAWKIPRKWKLLPALPVTARGKIDVTGLRMQVFGAAGGESIVPAG